MNWNDEHIEWNADGKRVAVGLTRFGKGKDLLLLPALSSISTRSEMRPLQERLGTLFATTAVDWPGFGVLPRPRVDWRPELYREFLRFLTESIIRPSATLAAGHAGSYALAEAADNPTHIGRLCLLSPTWRGPLPTMVGKRKALFRGLVKSVDLPLAGPLLYRLNVNGLVIGMMARGHVYADSGCLTSKRLAEKRAVTDAPGARHASFRFVAGELDLFANRAAFLDTARRIEAETLVVFGRETPDKSRSEMIALGSLSNVKAVELPMGKLSFYEEFPDQISEIVAMFLCQAS